MTPADFIGAAVGLVSAFLGGAVSYGMMRERVKELERRSEKMESDRLHERMVKLETAVHGIDGNNGIASEVRNLRLKSHQHANEIQKLWGRRKGFGPDE